MLHIFRVTALSAAIFLTVPVHANEPQIPTPDDFSILCQYTLNIPAQICECMSGKADTDLNDDERDFLLATLSKSESRISELKKRMPHESQMKAGLFFAHAPNDCSKELV